MGSFGHDFDFADSVGDYRSESWERALSSGASAWGEEYAGTLFFDAEGVQYLLSMYRVCETLAFLYTANDRGGVHLLDLVSVGDRSALDRFVGMPDLADMPAGSFLSWSDGTKAICDFLADPTTPSASVAWADVDTIPWPEP